MGNCLVMGAKLIRVMKPDGKILEYKAPLKAHQVMSDFPGHAISDTLPVLGYLRPDSEMIGGHLYYLLRSPPALPGPAVEKKRVRFANPEIDDGGEAGNGGVVRIKLVISKQELEVLLRKGGVSVVEDMVSDHLQMKQNPYQNEEVELVSDDNGSSEGWKPVLESIPEVN
ncbi:hypothetical protein U1Q18_014168 [Sarracenia purpurea var. burkii]